MSQTPVKANTTPAEVPGAPRKAQIERPVAPDTTITNLKLKFDEVVDEAVDTPSPLDTAMWLDEEAELEFINSIMNTPLGAFSYEGLVEAMMEEE